MSIADFHSHLIPGVDDGASDLQQSRAALAAFAAAGVTRLATTPHFQGVDTLRPEAFAARLAEIDAGWARLQTLAAEAFPQLELSRGVETMLDVPEPDLSDPRLRIAGGRLALVEFPFMSVPPRSAEALSAIRRKGFIPVVAHPERYAGVTPDLALVAQWRTAGGVLQVNGASLLGRYGAEARRLAWALLERGWVEYLCSDFHARGQPLMTEYRQAVEEAAGAETALLLTQVNPGRALDGEAPLPVPAFAVKRSFWTRLTGSLLGRSRGWGGRRY